MKLIKKYLFFTFALMASVYSVLFFYNNFYWSNLNQDDVNKAYERSITWIVNNQERIYNEHNAMLWWMLKEALTISDDPQLRNIVDNYKKRSYSDYHQSSLRYLVYESSPSIKVADVLTSGLPDYNLHFIYGFSCNSELGSTEIVKKQNYLNFCLRHHPLSPACLTHQLMGFRFMERSGCGDSVTVKNNIDKISEIIKYQLMIDFRVVDVYIQRVMMLLETGNREKVNNRWIVRILNSQLEDGGWGGSQPILPIGGTKYIHFSSKGLSIATPRSDFHATAQGVLLLAILKKLGAVGE